MHLYCKLEPVNDDQGNVCCLLEESHDTYLHTHIHTHIRTHTYTHTYIHIYIQLADKLAKAAVCNRDTTVSFNRIQKSTMYSEIEEEATQKWQKEWENCTKAAITKQFFPNVRDRVKMNINVNPNFTAVVTGN